MKCFNVLGNEKEVNISNWEVKPLYLNDLVTSTYSIALILGFKTRRNNAIRLSQLEIIGRNGALILNEC